MDKIKQQLNRIKELESTIIRDDESPEIRINEITNKIEIREYMPKYGAAI